jgi:hypothetical protein
MCDGYNATSGTTGANGRCGGPSVAPGGHCYLHYPLSYRLYCPDRPDHVLRRYEHSLGGCSASATRSCRRRRTGRPTAAGTAPPRCWVVRCRRRPWRSTGEPRNAASAPPRGRDSPNAACRSSGRSAEHCCRSSSAFLSGPLALSFFSCYIQAVAPVLLRPVLSEGAELSRNLRR